MSVFGKPKPQIVSNFSDACDLLARMGLDIVRRASDHKATSSVIIRNKGFDWVFAGDTEIFTLARSFRAPDDWKYENLHSWLLRKNFINCIYDQNEKRFIIMTNILVEGGAIFPNVARLACNFDVYIKSFLDSMNLEPRDMSPLE